MLQKDCIIFLLVAGQYNKTQTTIVSLAWNIILNLKNTLQFWYMKIYILIKSSLVAGEFLY